MIFDKVEFEYRGYLIIGDGADPFKRQYLIYFNNALIDQVNSISHAKQLIKARIIEELNHDVL